MTKSEAKDILINRLDFKVSGASPTSGIYFEGEHPIVTLENIKENQPEIGISDNDFTTYLTGLKESVVYEVLAVVFDRDYIDDNLLDFKPALFDKLISLQMTMKVINLIISSVRLNGTQRINTESLKQIYVDLNAPKGIRYEYDRECERVKNVTGGQRRFLSITSR